MAFLLEATLDSEADACATTARPNDSRQTARTHPMSLHISKLRGITDQVRHRLKRQGITYSHQLIAAAHDRPACQRLAALTGIDEASLGRLVRRADLARINGIGAIFADMLELLEVDGALPLARQDPVVLHAALSRLNALEQVARRAPTPDEVKSWIVQADALAQGSAGATASRPGPRRS
jgi:predicted flap endonuclease-1-like 5' DNA nuclease